MEKGVFLVAFLKIVIGDLGTQVVNMVKTNIPCEPLQDLR